MNKIAQYLNQYLLGEVTDNSDIKKSFSIDNSVIKIDPSFVIFPRNTNDMRKVARFSWQLAEKSHLLPVTTRGGGSNEVGSAIGTGICINTSEHLNKILYIASHEKKPFVHVQPGVNIDCLNQVLEANGLNIPICVLSNKSTIGGAIASNYAVCGENDMKMSDYISRLEVVLANGDVMETGLLSKHELNQKKGLSTFEGEIYREIDGLIEDYKDIIEKKIKPLSSDGYGYSSIANIKNDDGSFDLTPMIVGSEGTLGIVSEAVLRTDYSMSSSYKLATRFDSFESAVRFSEFVLKLKPYQVKIVDGRLYQQLRNFGKRNDLINDDTKNYIVLLELKEYTDRQVSKKVKKILKLLSKNNIKYIDTNDYDSVNLDQVFDVVLELNIFDEVDSVHAPILHDYSINLASINDFYDSLSRMEKNLLVEMPTIVNFMSGTVSAYPQFDLKRIVDKQKAIKMIDNFSKLVISLGGCIVKNNGEGRLKNCTTNQNVDDEVSVIYKKVKDIFDPHGIMNPGVKQVNDGKKIINDFRSDYGRF